MYEVTVEAGDGSLKSTLSVAVTVTNVDEPGTVSLSTTSPEKGTALTATLSDPDGGIADTTWQWQRRFRATDAWTDIGSAASSSYTPVAGDRGYMLRATVDYRDGHGPGKSAESTNTGAVTTVDPPGTVSLSTTSPEEGTAVTATLSDPSGGIDDVKWQWQRRARATDEWGGISSATSPSYTPVAGDVGYMLRATVGYSDGHGPNKSAHSASHGGGHRGARPEGSEGGGGRPSGIAELE